MAGILFLVRPLQAAGFGSTSSNLMAEGLAVRPLGVAGAAVALSGDESSLHVNPAGLSAVRGVAIGGGYVLGLLDTRLSFLDAAFAIGPRSSLGLQAAYLSDTDMRRDQFGNETGEFQNSNVLAGLALASSTASGWRWGLGAKGLQETYAGVARTSLAADFGLQAPLGRGWKLGAAVLNAGTQFADQNGASFAPPLRIQAGVASNFFIKQWTMELDLQGLPYEQQTRLLFGSELNFDLKEYQPGTPAKPSAPARISVRGGAAAGLLKEEPAHLNLGAGLTLPPTYRLDYALTQLGPLGVTHRFSLSLTFEGPKFSGPEGARLAAPYALRASETLEGFTLEWSDANPQVEGYNLYSDYGLSLDRVNQRPITKTKQRIKNPTRAVEYKFFVKAIGSDGKEGPASEVLVWVVK